MSSPLQTHHIASLTNEKKTSGKKSQDKSKNKNTFNVPDLAKAAAKAAKRKTAEDAADAEFDALEEEIIQKQRKLHLEFPEYVKNPSVRNFDFEEEEQPTIIDLRIEMDELRKLEADFRSGKRQAEISGLKEPTETNQGGGYDQKVISRD